MPLGILQLNEADERSIVFEPVFSEHKLAFKKIGLGTVIKLMLEFDEPFWTDAKKDLRFIFSHQIISTWWTKLPRKTNLLTGWAGGA